MEPMVIAAVKENLESSNGNPKAQSLFGGACYSCFGRWHTKLIPDRESKKTKEKFDSENGCSSAAHCGLVDVIDMGEQNPFTEEQSSKASFVVHHSISAFQRGCQKMAMPDSCCTCATLLSDVKLPYDPESEKPLLHNRRLDCCSRYICATCQHKNPRFTSYCPFCQISSGPSFLPKEGLRLPPSYTKTAHTRNGSRTESPPPSYDEFMLSGRVSDQSTEPPQDTEDTVHFVGLEDSLQSLSLAYGVPIPILRTHNHLYSDQLLQARKWVLIPRSHYTGPPLSTPPDPEEEERKIKLRRWMVATKCAEYHVAQLYLKGSDYNLEIAVEAFKADEEWEKKNPLQGKGKGRDKPRSRFGLGGSIAGQLS